MVRMKLELSCQDMNWIAGNLEALAANIRKGIVKCPNNIQQNGSGGTMACELTGKDNAQRTVDEGWGTGESG